MSGPPPVPVPTETAKKPRSVILRVLLWFGKLTGILILLVVLFVVVLALWPDKPEFDDSDIIPVWAEGIDDNPLARFQDWAEANSELFPEKGDARLNIYKKDAEWDGEAANALLEEHKEVLEQLRLLAGAAEEPWQWKGGADVARMDAPSPGYLIWAGRLEKLQCFRQIEQGRYDEAITTAHRMSVIGKKLSRSKGPLIHFLIGKTIATGGTQCIERLAKSKNNWYSPDRYEQVIEILDQIELKPKDLVFVLKTEYLSFKRWMSDIEAGKVSPSPFGERGFNSHLELLRFQRNETLALYREIIVPFIEDLEKGNYPPPEKIEKADAKIRSLKLNGLMLFVHPNATGKIWISASDPRLPSLSRYWGKSLANFRVTKTLIAIQAYESVNGQLPDSLKKLVPKYLTSTPIDPFSSKPLIWDLKKLVIYSVGQDRVDNGGMVNLNINKKGSDIGVKLEKLESTNGK